MTNVEVFKDTQDQIKTNSSLFQLNQNAVNNTCVYATGFVSDKIVSPRKTSISFEENLTLRAAIRMVDGGKKTAVLNFANPIEPGGGVLRGANAQEEYLCRAGNLYNCLISDNAKLYYQYHNELLKMNEKNNMFLGSDMIIYSPNVTFFKEDIGFVQGEVCKPIQEYTDKWRMIDVITCAAPFFSSEQYILSAGDLYHLLCVRIRNIFETAIENNVDAIILGAFGCGAFHNPPKVVAKAFKTVLLEKRYSNAFYNVIFAVKRSGIHCENINVFEMIFKEFVPSGESY